MTVPTQPEILAGELLVEFENWLLDEAGCAVTATSTAAASSSSEASHGADYLLVPDLDTAWRSGSIADLPDVDAGAISLRFDLGEPSQVDWVSIHRHNVRVPWRADLYRDDPSFGAVPIASSSWTDPIVRAALADYAFDDFDPGLGIDPRRIDQLTSLYRLDSFIGWEEVYQGIEHIVFSFDVAEGANGAKDYLQIAHPRAGRAFRPSVNMVLGWEVGVTDRSMVRRTESGSKRGRRKRTSRNFAFSLNYLEHWEAFRRILTDWMRDSGTLGLAFFWPQPGHREHFYDQAMLGQLEIMGKVAMALLEVPAGQGFQVEEAE